jgi:hypothetical protein
MADTAALTPEEHRERARSGTSTMRSGWSSTRMGRNPIRNTSRLGRMRSGRGSRRRSRNAERAGHNGDRVGLLPSNIDRAAQFGVLAGLSLALFGASSSLTTALVQATWRRGARSAAEAAADAKQELDELPAVQKLRLAALYTALQLG